MRLSKKWLKMAELYRHFAIDPEHLDFSDEAQHAMFQYETHGKGDLAIGIFSGGNQNGYAVGKHWLNVQVAEWIRDLGKTLWLPELYNGTYPIWWLDSIFAKFTDDSGAFHYSWLPSD